MANQFDPNRRFVRDIETRSNGFVEFEFAVSEPELAVELVLPVAAFEEFCARHKVIFLTDEVTPNAAVPAMEDEWNWNLRQATHQRFR